MRKNKGDQTPEESEHPAQDFFTAFGFSAKRGLYLPKAVIDTDRPHGEQQHTRKRVSRILRGWVPYLTVLLLATNAIILAQQCGIMKEQSGTSAAQATLMATQTVIMDRQRGISEQSMRVANRPYVQIGDSDGGKPIAEWMTEKGKRVGIKIHFWNAGSTPGTRLFVNASAVPGLVGPFHHLEQPVRNQYGVTTWIMGDFIPARGATSVQANIGESQIEKEFANVKKTKQIFQIDGDFEYTNVFDEWCCESYCLTLDPKGRFITCLGELRSMVCNRPDGIANVCEQRGEMKIPD
jgi:hypothetical protein